VDGQWDAVNGEVLRCAAVQASMDHDHQSERCSISDVKPVELGAFYIYNALPYVFFTLGFPYTKCKADLVH